jgi:dipeptidyl aminopeptidase/acylaminoacyl peptidase
MWKFKFLGLSVILCSLAIAFAGGKKEDYERANRLRDLTANKVYRDQIKANWLPDNKHFWYRVRTGQNSFEYILVNAETGKREPAFDHAKLATALKEKGITNVSPENLAINGLQFDLANNIVKFNIAGNGWKFNRVSNSLEPIGSLSEQTTGCKPLQYVPRASRRTGNEVYLTFINRTEKPVRLYWISLDGERISYATIQPNGQHRQHTFSGHVWLATDENGKPVAAFEAPDDTCECIIDGKTIPTAEGARNRSEQSPARQPARNVSPDGKWSIEIRDFNVFLKEKDSDREIQLTTDGTKSEYYTPEVYWSPDSKKVVVVRLKEGDKRKIYLIESSPKDQLQPKLHELDYLKPGDRVDIKTPCLFDISTKKQIQIDNSLFPNPWSISNLRWWNDSRGFVFLYNQRGHQVLRLLEVNATNGNIRPLIEEKSDTFIDYNGKFYMNILEESNEIIWMSERDGWNHLYLFEIPPMDKTAVSPKLKNQITKGEWVVRSVDFVDQKSRTIWFRAGGIRTNQDPYYIHYCKVNFDGSGLVILTEGDGTHEVEFSPDRSYLIDSWSRVDLPPVTELRSATDGRKICDLERANWNDLIKTGWKPPERFVAKGRDGVTDIYGIIIKPTNFDSTQKYPVIEHIYAGPQGAFVPKRFFVYNEMYYLAELGFIVVQIDGMGTSYRSKKFHDVCYKNLADAGFPDRKLWIKAAAKERPWMDITRVGIYGGSAGGQNAMRALIDHNDFYKVAAADCGCHDNRMDKIWWNELWMGWPVGPQYAECSNVTGAHKVQGKLLLTVGELDRNVDPASTMQVVNALIKANKDFDLLIIPGAGHGAGETPYGRKKRADFFVRHLLGVEPGM